MGGSTAVTPDSVNLATDSALSAPDHHPGENQKTIRRLVVHVQRKYRQQQWWVIGRQLDILADMINQNISERFYVVALEPGRETSALPTWADRCTGNVDFTGNSEAVSRTEIAEVPGAFQLLNLLTDDECDQFINISESLGYHVDSPVSLPHSVRHNNNVNWVVHHSIDDQIWRRCGHLLTEHLEGESALGLNARFRFYRYRVGDFFKPHTDGAWPGSRVVDGRLVHDAYGDRLSQMTCLIFLSDDYSGGRTLFYLPGSAEEGSSAQRAEGSVAISTPRGAALCFPHGHHPQHCLHAGEPVHSGIKYIIRTDVLFGLV